MGNSVQKAKLYKALSTAASPKLDLLGSWLQAKGGSLNRFKTLDRKPTVCLGMGWSNSTLYQNIKDGLFVPPVKLGPRSSGWPSDETSAIQSAYIAGWSKGDIRRLVIDLVVARKTAA